MPSERMDRLATISNALKTARKLTRDSRYGGLAELDDQLKAAVEALKWLRAYPDTLVEQFAALEHDQFASWVKLYRNEFCEETRAKLEPLMVPYAFMGEHHKPSDRAWARAVIDIFKTGWADLRRRE